MDAVTRLGSRITATVFLSSLSIWGCDCGEDPPVNLTKDGSVSSDGGFDDNGNPIDGGGGRPDFGFDDNGNLIDGGVGRPDFGFDDNGNPIDGGVGTPDFGFDDNGNPIDGGVGTPDFGFDDNGNPIDGGVGTPDFGFDDNGNPIDGAVGTPDFGFDDNGNPIDGGVGTPDFGFDDNGNPIDGGVGTPDFGFDDNGNPIDGGVGTPDFGFDDNGNPIDGGVGTPDLGFDDNGNPIDGGGSDGALGQPLSEFCQGTGAVVEVGAGGTCSGTVAASVFRFALCTCEGVVLQSNISVDAFDSRVGPYGGANILQDGHVGVDGALTAGGMMNVFGSVFVSGGGFSVGQQSNISLNVYSNGDALQSNSQTDIGRNMFVNGDVIGRYDIIQDLYVPSGAMVDPATAYRNLILGPIPPITPCPCGPAEILNVQAFVDFGRMFNDNLATGTLTSTTWADGLGPDDITLPCGRYYLTRIIHPRGITIIAQDRTVLYVDGDVTLGGGLRIQLDPGAELDLFIAGSLSLQAASRLGNEDQPSSVRTYVGGSNTIMLNASTVFGGNLYAPSADVMFDANADLYGALFCRNAIFGGSADIHFDNAIRSAGQQCFPDAGTGDGGVGGDGGAVADAGAGDAGDSGGAGDAGAADADSGLPDAGADAGLPCTQCFECGSLACIRPSGGGPGMCGLCTSDLDCCPTDICDLVTGRCFPTF